MQINHINSNSNPNFGMALKPFKTEYEARKILDIYTAATKGLKESAKDVNLDVSYFTFDGPGNCYIDIIASTLQKSIFQKLFKKPEEIKHSVVIHKIEELSTVPQFAERLVKAGNDARQKFFDESIEVGKKNLKKAMKPEKPEKRYPPYMGKETAAIEPPESKKSCCEIDVP